MRTTTMLTWMIAATAFFLAAIEARASPEYALDQSQGRGTLTVSGAEVVIVRGDGPAEVLQGLALPDQFNGVGYGVGLDQVWRLGPGVYTVTAYAPAVGALPRPSVVWEIEVEAAPQPDRIQRIADALARWIAVANDWAALAPTPEEVRDALLITFR